MYPILLIVGISFTDEDSIIRYGYSVLPKVFSTYAYRYVLNNSSEILHAYLITIITTVTGTVFGTASVAMYAYTISRNGFKYKKLFTFIMFFTMLFSGGMVSWYIICSKVLYIQNTIWALILPMLTSAWNVMIMRTFFQTTIPEAIIESAKLDGASELKTFRTIVVPLALPGIATIALFNTLSYWNDERACAAERGGHNDAQGERENGDMYACDRSDNTCVPVLPEILCSGTYGRRGQGVKY